MEPDSRIRLRPHCAGAMILVAGESFFVRDQPWRLRSLSLKCNVLPDHSLIARASSTALTLVKLRRSILTGFHSSFFLKAGIASIALAVAAPALAQEAAAPAQAAPAAPAAGASNFTEADIKQFAAAAVEVTKIQSDTSIADAEKQPKMLAALQASGIPPEKFNQIGQAAAADPALQQRIQAAAPASPAAPAAGAAPAAPAAPAQ